MHDAVIFSRQCKVIIRLLLHVDRLGRDVCSVCTKYCCNSATHVLFECDICDHIREDLWSNVLTASPAPLAEELMEMNSYECTRFILNGMNCKYVPEWKDLYISLCNFVYKMYTHYSSASNML